MILEEVLLFPQRSRPLYRKMQRSEGTNWRVDTEGEVTKFFKRDHHHKNRGKLKQNNNKNEDEQNNARTTVSEIRMINGGLVTRGSFKYLWKTHQR